METTPAKANLPELVALWDKAYGREGLVAQLDSPKYLSQPIIAGGMVTTRGAVIYEMQRDGVPQAQIDRYMQGLDAYNRKLKS